MEIEALKNSVSDLINEHISLYPPYLKYDGEKYYRTQEVSPSEIARIVSLCKNEFDHLNQFYENPDFSQDEFLEEFQKTIENLENQVVEYKLSYRKSLGKEGKAQKKHEVHTSFVPHIDEPEKLFCGWADLYKRLDEISDDEMLEALQQYSPVISWLEVNQLNLEELERAEIEAAKESYLLSLKKSQNNNLASQEWRKEWPLERRVYYQKWFTNSILKGFLEASFSIKNESVSNKGLKNPFDFNLPMIALYYRYLNLRITEDNHNAIAKEYGFKSGQRLIGLYNKFRTSTERADPKTAVKHIQHVISRLKTEGHDLTLAKSDLELAKQRKREKKNDSQRFLNSN